MSYSPRKSSGRLLIAVALISMAMVAWAQGAPPQPDTGLERCKFILSVVGYAGAVVAFVIGLLQYRRGEYWKRSQFLAQEMREFFEDPRVENARTMIDWGVRDIPLLSPSKSADGKEDSGVRTVDRQLQCKSLRPHDWPDADPAATAASSDEAVRTAPSSDEAVRTVPSSDGAVRTAPSSDTVRKPDSATLGGTSFEPEEAAIRDCYDRFLDGFERFGNYRRGNLVSVNDLKPYVQYWIDDIVDTKCDPTDSLWCVFLFAYIEFYSFVGVQALFDSFGHNIRIDSELVKRFAHQCADKPRATRLLAHVRKARSTPK
jgi:hypothetical protein